ncbi:MAG: hypothetical protein ACOC0P_07625 [Planctomycetota bacterium]
MEPTLNWRDRNSPWQRLGRRRRLVQIAWRIGLILLLFSAGPWPLIVDLIRTPPASPAAIVPWLSDRWAPIVLVIVTAGIAYWLLIEVQRYTRILTEVPRREGRICPVCAQPTARVPHHDDIVRCRGCDQTWSAAALSRWWADWGGSVIGKPDLPSTSAAYPGTGRTDDQSISDASAEAAVISQESHTTEARDQQSDTARSQPSQTTDRFVELKRIWRVLGLTLGIWIAASLLIIIAGLLTGNIGWVVSVVRTGATGAFGLLGFYCFAEGLRWGATAHRSCAGCGYPMAASDSGATPATRCPECGGAWHEPGGSTSGKRAISWPWFAAGTVVVVLWLTLFPVVSVIAARAVKDVLPTGSLIRNVEQSHPNSLDLKDVWHTLRERELQPEDVDRITLSLLQSIETGETIGLDASAWLWDAIDRGDVPTSMLDTLLSSAFDLSIDAPSEIAFSAPLIARLVERSDLSRLPGLTRRAVVRVHNVALTPLDDRDLSAGIVILHAERTPANVPAIDLMSAYSRDIETDRIATRVWRINTGHPTAPSRSMRITFDVEILVLNASVGMGPLSPAPFDPDVVAWSAKRRVSTVIEVRGHSNADLEVATETSEMEAEWSALRDALNAERR